MKKSLLLGITLSIIFIGTTQVNLDSGLVAFYPFESNANDLSTFAINGVPSGESYSTGVYGAPNSAIVFNGSDTSFVNCGVDNRGITDTIVISAFVRTTFDGIGDIVSKYDPGNDHGYHFQLSLGKIRLAGRDGSGNYRSTGFSLTDINDSIWHHVLGVVRGNTWLLYVDCSLEGAQSNNTVDPDISSGADLGIGKDVFSNQKYLDCEVDEVRIYNRELTQDEMDSLCATAVFASQPESLTSTAPHFQIFPNPANNKFTIATSFDLAEATIEIYDLTGKLVLQDQLQNNIPVTDISELEKGNYIVTIYVENHIITQKLAVI